MSTVIRFLETMGRDASLERLDARRFEEMVDSLSEDSASKQALLGRDASALSRLLDGRHKMYCFIMAPDDDGQKDGQVPDDEHDEPAEIPGSQGE